MEHQIESDMENKMEADFIVVYEDIWVTKIRDTHFGGLVMGDHSLYMGTPTCV